MLIERALKRAGVVFLVDYEGVGLTAKAAKLARQRWEATWKGR